VKTAVLASSTRVRDVVGHTLSSPVQPIAKISKVKDLVYDIINCSMNINNCFPSPRVVKQVIMVIIITINTELVLANQPVSLLSVWLSIVTRPLQQTHLI